MAATLPYVVVYCSSESSEAPARCLEEPGGGCWVSDARHRFPVEVGLWVGDATLEALRFVAHESLAPRRVEVYVASGEAEAPRDDFSREPEALATLRRRWRGEYGDAVFTRVGARTPRATPPPAADDDALLRSLETGLHRAKTSAPRRAAFEAALARPRAEARESAEEMRACAARDDFDGASAEQRRGRALREERLRCGARSTTTTATARAATRSPRRPEDDDDGDLPAPPRGAVFCHAWSRDAAAALPAARSPPTRRATTATSRRASRRARPRRRGATRRTPSSTWRRPRSSLRGEARVGATATRPSRRRTPSTESDESDGGAAGSDSEPDANDMTLTDASMMTSTIDGLASVAGDGGARHFAGGGSFDAALPVLSADGFWGFDERPLEPLEGVPLRLGGDDGDPRAAVERLLRGPETVSSRLVLWMDSENIADAGAVADALGQMHAVALSPPPPPPGGYEEWAVRRARGAAARPGPGDDGDGPFFAPPLAALLHARVDEDSGGGLRRVKIVDEAAKDSPRVVLVEDGATVGAARGEAALRAARCRAVDRALVAAVGDLALAFACQGNWIMRRQVFNLVRDGASRVDGAALGAAADDLALFEVDAERTRRYGAAPDDGGRGTGPPELAPFRRRRLLFAALNLIEPNEIRFIDAGQDAAASPQRRDDDDDDAHLRPWEVLRLGVRSTGLAASRAARGAVDAALRHLGFEAPPTLLKPKHRLRAGDDDAETDARLAADPTRRRRNDPSLAPWLLGPLARVDLEMERKYGSAPSVAAEAKQLKKAAQAAAAAREAAGRAAEAARDAHATAADALRRAYEAAEAARHRDARDRAYRPARPTTRSAPRRGLRGGGDEAAPAARGAGGPAHAERRVPRENARRGRGGAAAAEEQRRKDEEVKDVELAMVASNALDAAPAPGDDGAHATGGATAKAPSRAPTPRETPRPDGKVHPLPADGGDAAAPPAAGDKDKKGCAVM
ncbi:hypothetical protein JL721_7231 [Aureococcus anophagefferens]|nr:hypothetical protein JL721_7231 [Aureococcus anophagefferens]